MVFRYGVPQHLKEFLQNLNDVSQVLRQRFSCFKFPKLDRIISHTCTMCSSEGDEFMEKILA